MSAMQSRPAVTLSCPCELLVILPANQYILHHQPRTQEVPFSGHYLPTGGSMEGYAIKHILKQNLCKIVTTCPFKLAAAASSSSSPSFSSSCPQAQTQSGGERRPPR